MKLSQFNYKLPKEQIALHPSYHRDESKMLVLNKKTGEITHKLFKDLTEYFGKDDVFILNNTRVFPAKLLGNKEKTNAMIEVFLLRELKKESLLWDVLVDPARKIRIGNKLFFGEDDSLVAEVIDNTTSRGRTLKFMFDGTHEEFKEALFALGETPLPDYIERPVVPEDEERYQTIYATEEGAVVGPSAGFHFSRELFKRLELQDCRFAYLTLHASRVMYSEIDVDDLSKFKMGSERMIVNEDCCDLVNNAIRSSKRVCAVGTTSMKAVETCVSTDGFIKPYDGWTGKFIFPEYHFEVADSMITGFHMPYSSLLMMVAAFGGYDNVMNAYKVAIEEGYRFGAYGDAMLII
ncbi:tRNA preQ1(34) S-adenosylmethionine ribosyltransferase-isomerase QueA [Porphyromonadaceae bacterium W3.11]|nr:tRNA preQ1(34) S-adenosylmethionine ribosyltransferase-isomerase QueA [Porphyromonadaceae bacterium W3.11]